MIEDPGPERVGSALDGVDHYVLAEVSRIRRWHAASAAGGEPLAADIAREAAVLSRRVTAVAETIRAALLASWRELYGRHHPGIAVLARFTATATGEARYTVLCQRLYPTICAADIVRRGRSGAAAPIGDVATSRDRLARQIVTRTWGPLHTRDFLRAALELIEMRLADGRCVPVTPLDPLTEALTSAVCDRLVRDGLPPV